MRLTSHKGIYDVIKERYNHSMWLIRPVYSYLAIQYLTDVRDNDEFLVQRRYFGPITTLIMSILFPPFTVEHQIVWKMNKIRLLVKNDEFTVSKAELKNIPRYKELVEFLIPKYGLTKEQIDKADLYVHLDGSSEFTKYLEGVLKKHAAEYVNDSLGRITTNYYSFERQLNLFKQYINSIAHIRNLKYFDVSNEDLHKFEKSGANKYQFDLYTLMFALKYANCINIYGAENVFIKDISFPSKYSVSIGLRDIHALNTETIRNRLGLPEANKRITISTDDNKYIYDHDTHALVFQLPGGSVDQFDFGRAKTSRKVFETFWTLHKKDPKGEYSREAVCEMYRKLHGEIITISRIGETVSNIRSTIINPKTLIKDKIEWRFDREKEVWIFKILA